MSELEGGNKICLSTLNEKNEVIAEQELPRDKLQILNDEYVLNFDKQANDKNTLVINKKFPTHKVTLYQIRPANVNKQLFQQSIMEITDQH